MNEEFCVCCGVRIPEGYQICPHCEKKVFCGETTNLDLGKFLIYKPVLDDVVMIKDGDDVICCILYDGTDNWYRGLRRDILDSRIERFYYDDTQTWTDRDVLVIELEITYME